MLSVAVDIVEAIDIVMHQAVDRANLLNIVASHCSIESTVLPSGKECVSFF